MNISKNKLEEIFEHIWGSYCYKQPRKIEICTCENQIY